MKTIITGSDRDNLVDFARAGLADFETQMKDPRLLRDNSLDLDANHRAFSQVVAIAETSPTIHARLFDRDQTNYLNFLVSQGEDPTPDLEEAITARLNDESIGHAHSRLLQLTDSLNDERRTTDSDNPRTYNQSTLAAAASKLSNFDWDAHRRLAQIAVESGYCAEVTENYDNDTASTDMVTYSTKIIPIDQVERIPDQINFDEGPMGSAISVEQFTPDAPYGNFGVRTPVEASPAHPSNTDFPNPYADLLNSAHLHNGPDTGPDMSL